MDTHRIGLDWTNEARQELIVAIATALSAAKQQGRDERDGDLRKRLTAAINKEANGHVRDGPLRAFHLIDAAAIQEQPMTEEERRQRLEEIRERRLAAPKIGYLVTALSTLQGGEEAAYLATSDIDFLLSLLNSQAAKGDAADRGISKLLLASDLTAEAYRKGWSDAATRMRECVEKVKAMRDGWHDRYVAADSSTREALVRKEMLFAQCCAARDIIKEIEPLTLDQMEQEK